MQPTRRVWISFTDTQKIVRTSSLLFFIGTAKDLLQVRRETLPLEEMLPQLADQQTLVPRGYQLQGVEFLHWNPPICTTVPKQQRFVMRSMYIEEHGLPQEGQKIGSLVIHYAVVLTQTDLKMLLLEHSG